MKKMIWFGISAALFLAVILSPFASSWPDGLERVAKDKGFLEKGEGKEVLVSPIPDYALPGVKSEKIATSLAGLIGTLITFGLAYGVGAIVKRNEA